MGGRQRAPLGGKQSPRTSGAGSVGSKRKTHWSFVDPYYIHPRVPLCLVGTLHATFDAAAPGKFNRVLACALSSAVLIVDQELLERKCDFQL
jgi:hypothetical protein